MTTIASSDSSTTVPTTTTTTSGSARARFPLRGYERFMSMAGDGSMKIVHVMAIQGGTSGTGIAAFIKHLPEAVVATFSRHPRMRVIQVRDEFAMAEVQPMITLETIAEKKLLEIREVKHDDNENWETFAEVQSNIPFDRYSQLPWFVRAWHYPALNRVRLMVLSDHYMSDGISGLVVMNDIVTFASSASQQLEPDIVCALPLRPSLYEMWLEPHKWTLRFRRWAIKLFGKAIFKSEIRSFTPVIQPRSDQADFAIPLKINSSSALFGQGTPENMDKALRRCKEEDVTFFGALTAAAILAYYLGSEQDKKNTESSPSTKNKPFKLTIDFDFNMRKRVPFPVEEDSVGTYLATSTLESLRKQGVDFDTTGFWDLARSCKTELDNLLESFMAPLTMVFLDEFIHSETQPELAKEIPTPYSISSDVNLSNIGKYPYKLTHTFGTTSAPVAPAAGEESVSSCNTEELRIESVHVYNSNPHLGSPAILYVTSTDKFNYSMMYKYEPEDAKRVFAAFAMCIECIGEVTRGETMAQVAEFVAESVKTERQLSSGKGSELTYPNLC